MAKIDKSIRKQMRAAGWEIRGTVKTHEKWFCPCGVHGPCVRAASVGGGRGAMNFRALMRRQGGCSVDLKLG